MSIFKEKKPLIEWEKEFDVWKDNLLPRHHFMEYTKLEAFNIFNLGSIRRNWGCRENEIYRNYLSCIKNDTLCLNSGINYTVIDNRKKSLIEWEKEFGFWIVNASIYEHKNEYNKSEAEELLYSNCFVSSWNDEAEKLYFNCLYNNNCCMNKSLVVKDFQYVNVVPVEDECNKNLSLINNFNKKKHHKRIFIDKNINVNGYSNKVKVRGKGLKKVFALIMSLFTTISVTGFSNSSVQIHSVDNEIKSTSSFVKFEDSIYFEKKSNIKGVNNYNDLDSKSIVNDNRKINRNLNVSGAKIENVGLGDIVNIKQGSKVYDNVYSAIDKSNGLDSFYSFDFDRCVNYVALNYNNDIIYSNDIDEITKYEECGASVVSVCTDDGFYNSSDIVVKVKKMNK